MKNKLTFFLIITLFIINGAQAQNKKRSKKVVLKGLVIDTENKAVQNASVFINGKNRKILTDVEGRFKLKIKADVKTIMVFTVAQGATEINYNGEEELTFVLKSVDKVKRGPLNTDYIKAHKRNLTTSAREKNRNTINNADHYITIYDMIKGEVAGVTVSGSTVRIRGVGSLTMSNTPLYVVNGMPVGSIDYISPSEVKSISVLKGSAAAIYGIRGANGVILITLRKVIDN